MVTQDIKDLIEYLDDVYGINIKVRYCNCRSHWIAGMNAREKLLQINVSYFCELNNEQQYAVILHEYAHYDCYANGYRTGHTGVFGKTEAKLLKTFGLKRKRSKYTNRYRYTELPILEYIRE